MSEVMALHTSLVGHKSGTAFRHAQSHRKPRQTSDMCRMRPEPSRPYGISTSAVPETEGRLPDSPRSSPCPHLDTPVHPRVTLAPLTNVIVGHRNLRRFASLVRSPGNRSSAARRPCVYGCAAMKASIRTWTAFSAAISASYSGRRSIFIIPPSVQREAENGVVPDPPLFGEISPFLGRAAIGLEIQPLPEPPHLAAIDLHGLVARGGGGDDQRSSTRRRDGISPAESGFERPVQCRVEPYDIAIWPHTLHDPWLRLVARLPQCIIGHVGSCAHAAAAPRRGLVHADTILEHPGAASSGCQWPGPTGSCYMADFYGRHRHREYEGDDRQPRHEPADATRGHRHERRQGGRRSQGLTSGRCFGGHGTLPYEQKTQQSPGFGRSSVPQYLQS